MNIILMILATWRISSLFVDETGPWDIFEKFRTKLGIEPQLNKDGEIYIDIPFRLVPQMFGCIWCISMWVGAIFFLLPSDLAQMIAFPFALSAGTIIIDNYLSGG